MLLILPMKTWASGCAWTTEYALGEKLLTRQSEGQLRCEHANGYESCSYYDQSAKRVFLYSGVIVNPILSDEAQIKIAINRYDAMEWYNCDGGDTAPEYKSNGNLEKFEIEGKEFISFVAN